MGLTEFKRKGRLLILLFILVVSGSWLAPAFAQTYSLTLTLKEGSVSLANLVNYTMDMYQVPGSWTNNDIISNIVVPLYNGDPVTNTSVDKLTLSKVGTVKYPTPLAFRFKWTGSHFVIIAATNVLVGSGLEVDINGLKLGKKLVPVIATSTHYAILTSYAIPSSADVLGKKVGESWTWSGSQKIAGQPPAPTVTNSSLGFVNEENVGMGEVFLQLAYDPNYDYTEMGLEVAGFTKITTSGKPATKLIGQIALGNDHLDLEAGTEYTLDTTGTNLFGTGTPPNQYIFTTEAVAAAQTFILTLESQAVGTSPGPGINSFGLGIGPNEENGVWYAFDKGGQSLISPTATNGYVMETALDLIDAINRSAKREYGIGTNVVSTFGIWDKSNQIVKDFIFEDNIQTSAQISELTLTPLEQGVGYQVYITDVPMVEILIKNRNE